MENSHTYSLGIVYGSLNVIMAALSGYDTLEWPAKLKYLPLENFLEEKFTDPCFNGCHTGTAPMLHKK